MSTLVIVGAGIVGASAALELRRRGHTVLVIDRLDGPGLGSTALSSSVIRCHYTREDAIAIAHEGCTTWESWADHVRLPRPRARYHATGVLFLLREGSEESSSEGLGVKAEMNAHGIAERHATMRRLGVEVDLLRSDELRDRFPALAVPDSGVVGMWEPRSGYVAYPTEAVEDLREAGEQEGVTFRFQTRLVDATTEWVGGRRVVRALTLDTPQGPEELSCDTLINCAGPDSHAVNIAVGCPLPLTTTPLRQYIVEARWAGEAPVDFPPMADLAEGFYIRPDPQVFKVGAALAEDHVDFTLEPNAPPDPARLGEVEAAFLQRMKRRLPSAELKDVTTRVAYYDWTVGDSYPLVGATDVGGYYVAIGTSGAWFKSGFVLAYLVAECITRDEAGDPNPEIQLPLTGISVHRDSFSPSPEARRS